MRQVGRALSIVLRHQAMEMALHNSVDRWGAPSECHALVARGETSRERLAWRHARAVSGISRSALSRLLERLPMRTVHRVYDQIEQRMGVQ